MNSTKTLLFAGLAACLIAVAVAAFYLTRHQPAEEPLIAHVTDDDGSEWTVSGGGGLLELAPTAGATQSQPVSPSPSGAPAAGTPVENLQPAPGAPPTKLPYKPGLSKFKKAREPMARVALEFVGADQESERIWLAAINDPTVPAEERKDLIEDLNEDGISDPRNPTRKDLGLIQGRIALIEQLLPDALDRVNADAFREAHKDLLNLNARLNGK